MKITLFGKEIFNFKKSDSLVYNSMQGLKDSKFLPDFYTFRENQEFGNFLTLAPETTLSVNGTVLKAEKNKEKVKKSITPKNLYELKTLHTSFKMNVNEKYVDEQIQQFKDKLNLIKITEFDVSRGTNEIASILIRMENRKKYADNKEFFEDYAYTTTSKINEVISNHENLQLGKIEQFIADLPQEAVNIMKDYTKDTEMICEKKPIFYIIADKKDFKKSDKRRDPILLAQSPFGHFWQILGAWDSEMLFLEEL